MRIGRHQVSWLHKSLCWAVVAVSLREPLLSLRLHAVSLLAESLGHCLAEFLSISILNSSSSNVSILRVRICRGVGCHGVVVSSGQVEGSLPSLGRRSAGVALRRGGHGLTDWGARSGGGLTVAAVATSQGQRSLTSHNIVLLLVVLNVLVLLLLELLLLLLERLHVMR